MELFKNYNDDLVKSRYKNWILFIVIPIGLVLLIEVYFEWPYRILPEESKETYLQVMLLVATIVIVTSFIVLAINYWHFKKSIKEKVVRNIHSILSVFLIFCWLLFAKIQMLGALLNLAEFGAVVYPKIPGLVFRRFEMIEVVMYWLAILFAALQGSFIIYIILKTFFRKDIA